MCLKRCFLFVLLILLAINLISPMVVNATTVNITDGSISISNGEISLTGPSNITTQGEAMATVIDKYKDLITFISGIITVTMVAIFIVQFVKLGMIPSNPRERKEILVGLLISGFSAALMGSITLFVGVFYGLLK